MADLDIKQQQSLQAFIECYNQRTITSKQFTQAYRSVLADNRVPAGFLLPLKELCYPIVATRSQGSKVWDVDGNEYIDFMMGFGSNLLGHNPPFVKNAISEQLEKGIQIGPQAEFVGEVAELIAQLTGMERVAFSNTGTEAVMSALRLARAATGRNKIALFAGSYHGHFDGTLAKVKSVSGQPKPVPMAPGILPSFIDDILLLDYGNPQSLERIQANGSQLAAVLVEPVQSRRLDLQPKDFLQQLRKLTQASGIALIFDEMVSGLRIHPGGAQAWFGVEADIATYGKIVGGGLPIGVIAGKATYLDQIDGGWWDYGDASSPQVQTTFFAGTHCKHPLAIAAARSVLQYLKAQGPQLQQQLNQRTAEFVQLLNATLSSEGLPIQMTHFGSIFGPVTSWKTNPSEAASSMAMSLFAYHLRSRGILLRGGGGFLSTAHTDEDLERLLQAVRDSVQELRSGGFLPG